jgi:hypothetical protein
MHASPELKPNITPVNWTLIPHLAGEGEHFQNQMSQCKCISIGRCYWPQATTHHRLDKILIHCSSPAAGGVAATAFELWEPSSSPNSAMPTNGKLKYVSVERRAESGEQILESGEQKFLV